MTHYYHVSLIFPKFISPMQLAAHRIYVDSSNNCCLQIILYYRINRISFGSRSITPDGKQSRMSGTLLLKVLSIMWSIFYPTCMNEIGSFAQTSRIIIRGTLRLFCINNVLGFDRSRYHSLPS